MMGDAYTLIDLQAMYNEEIKQKSHLGMLEYFLKNIHERYMIKVWKIFFEHFNDMIDLDRNIQYLYIKKFIWYTELKVEEKDKDALYKMITEHLPNDEGEQIMTTIAENYIQQGMQQGIQQGMQQIAMKMLSSGMHISLISSLTNFSENEILKFKNLEDRKDKSNTSYKN